MNAPVYSDTGAFSEALRKAAPVFGAVLCFYSSSSRKWAMQSMAREAFLMGNI